jgi:hypothetical protein
VRTSSRVVCNIFYSVVISSFLRSAELSGDVNICSRLLFRDALVLSRFMQSIRDVVYRPRVNGSIVDGNTRRDGRYYWRLGTVTGVRAMNGDV